MILLSGAEGIEEASEAVPFTKVIAVTEVTGYSKERAEALRNREAENPSR